MTRVLPRFPTAVRGINALSATTQNGVLEIGIDPTNLAESADPTAPGNYTVILKSSTNELELAEVASTIVDIATKEEAEAGTDNTAILTPLRAAQEIEANVFPTRSDLLVRSLPAVQTRVRTSGYSVPGVGAAEYVAVGSEPAHPGKFQTPDGRWWEITQSPDVSVLMFGAVRDGSSNTTTHIKAAIVWAAAVGNGRIVVPAGNYKIGPLDSYVADDEGTGIILTSAMSKVSIIGAGRGESIFTAASNKVEMFAQNGATDIVFENIVFDNPYGPLQGTEKKSFTTPGGGVAAKGNAANAAVRQYKGANLRFSGCSFRSFLIASEYIGNADDTSELVGDFYAEDCSWRGCCQGMLLHQPARIFLTNLRNEDNCDSDNASGVDDPGHLLYVTNRSGARPDQIIVSGIQDKNGASSVLKIRKGKTVTISDVTSIGSGRGIEIIGAENGTLTNFTIVLGTPTVSFAVVDNARSALGLEDNGNFTVSNGSINVSGVDAWGVRVEPETAPETWSNKSVSLNNIQVMTDMAVPGKDAFIVQGQQNFRARNCGLIHNGTTPTTRYVFSLTDCSNPQILDPYYRTPDSPASARDRLVRVLSGTTKALVKYSRFDIDVTPTTSTVTDAGTDTVVIRDGEQIVNWTPVLTFTTPGDIALANTTGTSAYGRRVGNRFIWAVRVNADVTHTSASGELVITGLPFEAAAGIERWVGTMSYQNLTLGGSAVEVVPYVGNGESQVRFRVSANAGAGSSLGTAAIPTGTTGVRIHAYGEFEIA